MSENERSQYEARVKELEQQVASLRQSVQRPRKNRFGRNDDGTYSMYGLAELAEEGQPKYPVKLNRKAWLAVRNSINDLFTFMDSEETEAATVATTDSVSA